MRARVGATLASAALAASCLLTGAPAASASAPASHGGPGGPTAAQVQASKDRVARLERQVRAASDAVAASQAALDHLATAAEVAIEGYDKAVVVETAAQQRLAADQTVLDAAAARVSSARGRVGEFAADAYRGGQLSDLEALLSSDGPQTMLYRLSQIDAVARVQRNVLEDLAAARVYQHGVQQQSAAIAAQAAAAAKAAARARDHAQRQVAAQTAAVAGLKQAQQHLADVLRGARAHASALERERLAALARARAEAAARRAAAAAAALRRKLSHPVHSFGGGGGSFANTVSAATERAALNYAESQLGKPYEWGAAGPDTYDCSGLVMWAYAQVGVTVDHWTGFQWNEGAHIPLSDLRAGDLVFFATDTNDANTIHHVGMYIGDGQMVEAPYTGANVRISNAFRPDLIGAVRLYQH